MKNAKRSFNECNDSKVKYEVQTNKCAPPPPPLPYPALVNESKLIPVYKSKTIGEEVKSLWESKEMSVRGEDIPSKFALIKLEPVLQEGPNCGLAALAMAATATPKKLVMEELFLEAKSNGFTNQGEMFSAVSMAQLSKSVIHPWFTVELLTGGLSVNRNYVLQNLFKGALLLVPYDADGNCSPCCKKGHRSHWAVICGVATVEGGEPDVYLFARQGKSKYLTLWSYDQLEESNNNLVEFDPKRAEDGTEYVLPIGGVEAGLCGKVVLLNMLQRGPDFTSINDL